MHDWRTLYRREFGTAVDTFEWCYLCGSVRQTWSINGSVPAYWPAYYVVGTDRDTRQEPECRAANGAILVPDCRNPAISANERMTANHHEDTRTLIMKINECRP